MANSKKATRVRLSMEGVAPIIIRHFTTDMIGLDWPNSNTYTTDSQGNSIADVDPAIHSCDITVPMSATTPPNVINTLSLMYDMWETGLPLRIEVEQGGSLGFTMLSNKGHFTNPPRPDGAGKEGGGVWNMALRADNLKPKSINAAGRAVDELASIVNI